MLLAVDFMVRHTDDGLSIVEPDSVADDSRVCLGVGTHDDYKYSSPDSSSLLVSTSCGSQFDEVGEMGTLVGLDFFALSNLVNAEVPS